MPEMSTDDIAREAARLIELGRAATISDAISMVTDRMGERERRSIALPSHGMVRRHAQGFAMQSLGEAGYQATVRRVYEIAEEIMTAVESFPPILAGRAAKGQIDAGVHISIRVYTNEDLRTLIEMLIGFGYDEPAIATINTRWGRLNRLQWEEDGQPVIVTRCLPEMFRSRSRSLHRDASIAIADLNDVRQRLRAE